MEENIITDSVSDENVEIKKIEKRYQWIKGDTIGDIEIFDQIKEKNGKNWIYFKGGRRIDANLLSEMMYEIGENEQPLNLGLSMPVDPFTRPVEQVVQKNPIRILLEKQKKTKQLIISHEIVIDIPETGVYEMMIETFGEEVKDQLTDIILGKLDLNQIQQDLKKTIIETLNTQYNIK